jgi:hypothetical protein
MSAASTNPNALGECGQAAGQWQKIVFDFRARFDQNNHKTANAASCRSLNDKVIHENVEMSHARRAHPQNNPPDR